MVYKKIMCDMVVLMILGVQNLYVRDANVTLARPGFNPARIASNSAGISGLKQTGLEGNVIKL